MKTLGQDTHELDCYLYRREPGWNDLAGRARDKGLEGSLHYLQDSASIHTTPIVSEWARNTGVSIITLPSKSPDLNIIDNIWSRVKAGLG